MLDILRCAANGRLESISASTAVTLDHDSLQAQKTSTVVLRRIELRAQSTQQRQRNSTNDTCCNRAPEQRLDLGDQHASQTLAGFEQDVTDETIAYHDVCFAAIQPIALDETTIVEASRLLQQRSRELDLLIALDFFGADIQQRDPRLLPAQGFRRHGPHHRELIELLGRTVDICTEVQ